MSSPNDPLYQAQWHFDLLGDIETVWEEYTGNGVSVGVYDDGIQSVHEDLDDNYDASLEVEDNEGEAVDAEPNLSANDSHGTAVAGIIAAEANNGIGGVGVAHEASVTSVNIFDHNTYGFVNATSLSEFEAFLDVIDQGRNFDIMSNSWGVTPLYAAASNNNSWAQSQFMGAYAEISEVGRGGLGTIIVQAAGNQALDANGSGTNASRHTITVGATDDDGFVQSYSNYGASILISAPAASVTTDLLGSDGYNTPTSSNEDYTNQFGGTSAATPVASGVIALMLEANETLGWRDVQNILATSAAHTGSDLGRGPGLHENDIWVSGGGSHWNGGGLTFNGSYGYGMVDSFAAVRMAEAWQYFVDVPQTSANEQKVTSEQVTFSGSGLAIPEGNAQGVSFDVEVTDDLRVEHAQMNLNFSHDYIGDLTIYVTDPTGVEKQVVLRDGFGSSVSHSGTWPYGLDNFLGVNAKGTWTIRIVDNYPAADSGFVLGANFEFYGSLVSNDDVYHYTDDIFDYIAVEEDRQEISDTNGGNDWLNLSAISEDLDVNLISNGSGHVTARTSGQVLADIAAGSVLENVVTGDGADSVIGSNASNHIVTGRGNDSVMAGKGSDTVELGAGDDFVLVGGGVESFDGGTGNDTISYYNSSNGIMLNMTKDLVSGSFEEIDASSFSSAANALNSGLVANVLTGIQAVRDSAKNFENFIGSNTGDDTVVGTNGGNLIQTLGGDDILYGGSGEDTLNGGAGDDLLTGGADADVFHFDFGSAEDLVQDFESNIDTLLLSGFGFSSVADAFEFAVQVGSSVVFDFNVDDTLTLAGVTIEEIYDDFQIV